jgi:hypothetical protein
MGHRDIRVTKRLSDYFTDHICNRKQFDVSDCPKRMFIGFKCIGCGTNWYITQQRFKRIDIYLIPNEMGRTAEGRKIWVEKFNRYPEIKVIRGE